MRLNAKRSGGEGAGAEPIRATGEDGAVANEIRESCLSMTRYLLATGIPVPPWIVTLLNRTPSVGAADPAELVKAHDYLARAVHPALPRTLVLLDNDQASNRFLRVLGPVKLVRQLMIASLTFLTTFIATSLSPDVNIGSGDLFQSSGLKLLVNEAFFLSAAGIGASFSALFQVNRYIASGTYDPRFDTSYWTRFILGLIAGIVLAQLIPVEGSFTRPLLALVGGFSASVVYRILTRIVDTLESFVSGEAPSGTRTEPVAVGDWTSSAERAEVAQALIALRRDATDDPESAVKGLDEVLLGLVGTGGALASQSLQTPARPGS